MEEILLGYLGKTLNMPTEQLAELLYKKSDDGATTTEVAEDALSKILALDAERVQKLKPNTKEYFDNGYKKAQSEVAAQIEKMFRSKFGVDPEGQLQGEALADAIKAAFSDQTQKPEKVKVHPEYLALERQMREALEAQKSEFEKQVEAMKSEAEREKTWSGVSSSIRDALMSLNPVLPSDTAKADRLINLFMQEFRGFDYQRDENDGFLPIKEGKRVEDQHGYPRKLADLVRERAEQMFEFAAQAPAGNAGNQNGGRPPVTMTFKDEGDFYRAMAEAGSDPAKAKEVSSAWKAQQAQSKAN